MLVLALRVLLQAQAQAPTFRTGTTLVEFTVVAFDGKGNPIADLTEADLAPVLSIDPQPEFLLLGTGDTLVRPAPALIKALGARGIGVEAMDSRAAARAWGVLRAEDRWIGAALMALA